MRNPAILLALIVQAGQRKENFLLDTVGRDIFRFEELIYLFVKILERHVIIFCVHLYPGFTLTMLVELFARDRLILLKIFWH